MRYVGFEPLTPLLLPFIEGENDPKRVLYRDVRIRGEDKI